MINLNKTFHYKNKFIIIRIDQKKLKKNLEKDIKIKIKYQKIKYKFP